MPRWFAEHAQKTEERARRRCVAQAKRFELESLCVVEMKNSNWQKSQEWQDTVAEYSAADDLMAVVVAGPYEVGSACPYLNGLADNHRQIRATTL